MDHELVSFQECSLANSGLIWNDGYDRAICSCGWKSAPSRGQDKHVALVALFELHVKTSLLKESQKEDSVTVKAKVVKQEAKLLTNHSSNCKCWGCTTGKPE